MPKRPSPSIGSKCKNIPTVPETQVTVLRLTRQWKMHCNDLVDLPVGWRNFICRNSWNGQGGARDGQRSGHFLGSSTQPESQMLKILVVEGCLVGGVELLVISKARIRFPKSSEIFIGSILALSQVIFNFLMRSRSWVNFGLSLRHAEPRE